MKCRRHSKLSRLDARQYRVQPHLRGGGGAAEETYRTSVSQNPAMSKHKSRGGMASWRAFRVFCHQSTASRVLVIARTLRLEAQILLLRQRK